MAGAERRQIRIPPTTNHQPPTTNHQPPTTNHQPPTTNHQPPTTNHQPPTSIPAMKGLEIIDPVDLAARLMEIDSTSGREGPIIDWMSAFLAEREWLVRRIPVSAGRDDLYVTANDEEPRVVLSTHLDTVPPHIPPRIEGDRLW